MILKLGARNLSEKPGKAIATILAIALAVAILFCVFSYGQSVNSFIYALQTADSGDSDITISYRSDGSRIANLNALAHLSDDFEYSVGALSIYGLFENEKYVYLRGFDRDNLETLNNIECVKGSIAEVATRSDNVVISQNTAKELGLSIDSEIPITVMGKTKLFYVAAIAKDGGMFANNSPYNIIGINSGVSRFFNSEWGGFYSEIYIKLKSGVSITNTIEQIKNISEYKNMKVERSIDLKSIKGNADILTAPVKLAGVAVILLAICGVIVLFATNEKAKRTFISKMTAVGATKKQVSLVIAVETAIFAVGGSIIGGALAIGVYKLLLNLTLGSAVVLSISLAKLMLAMFIGTAVAMTAGFLPMYLARRKSVRENLLATSKTNWKIKLATFIVLVVAIAVCLSFEFAIRNSTSGIFAVSAFLLIIFTVVTYSPMIMNLISKMNSKVKSSKPEFTLATINLSRVGSSRRGVQILVLGMMVSVMLFVAWNVSTVIFSTLTSNFDDMVLVTNVPADESLPSELEGLSGVRSAFGAVWKTAQVDIRDTTNSISVLGAKEVLDCIEFEYITDETTTRDILNAGLETEKPYVFLDYSYVVLYGVSVGDSLTMTLEDKTADFVVGGILRNELFTGNYVVVSREQMSKAFGLAKFDTIVMYVDDVEKTIGELRVSYADRNFFVVGAVENFRFVVAAMSDVLSLLGVLAFAIAIMSGVSVVANTVVSRSARSKERTQFLVAGMSKKSLLRTEVFEHLLTGVVAFAFSYGLSDLLSVCLIDSMLLFDVYLEYVFAKIPALLVSASMAIAYIVMPFVANYKKQYSTALKIARE